MRTFPARLVHNLAADRNRAYGERERRVLNRDAARQAWAELTSWSGYAPTPLLGLSQVADALDLSEVLYKDESSRFGLGSFKALGGAYAVLAEIQKRPGGGLPTVELMRQAERGRPPGITVATATDGNHGRSVAWGAAMFGCRCIIYLHEHVSPEREAAIASYGAEIRRVPGHYDDSVRQCAADAAANGWALVPDTSDDEDAPVPARVMQGYTVLAQEILNALPSERQLTHLFVQAGVGGLAAALAGHFWELLGPTRPRVVVVEPDRADCVWRSVAAGRPEAVPGEPNTFMACLAAAEISAPAWVILRHAVDDVLAIPDEAARDAMRILADGQPAIVAGESGCAAFAGLLAAANDPHHRAALGLSRTSRVLVIGSEGATDAAAYRATVGRTPEQVAA